MDTFFEVVQIEEIQLDTAGPEQLDYIVSLHDPMRPKCLFGWWAPAVDLHDFESDRLDDARDLGGSAEGHAFVLYANLGESILAIDHGLPRDCYPNGIIWF